MIKRPDPARAGISELPSAARLRAGTASSYVDVMDRVLDKGIVIDAWMRVSVGGIYLMTLEARVIVASIDSYLRHSPAFDGAAALAETTPELLTKRRPSGLRAQL
jgi:gas vesicle protein GvpA/GvpJ/GvpM family